MFPEYGNIIVDYLVPFEAVIWLKWIIVFAVCGIFGLCGTWLVENREMVALRAIGYAFLVPSHLIATALAILFLVNAVLISFSTDTGYNPDCPAQAQRYCG
jgi:Na+/serine symporter